MPNPDPSTASTTTGGSRLTIFLALAARRRTLMLFVFVLAVFAAYFPVLSGEFVWDDIFLVGKNPFFKSPVFFFEVFRHWLFLDSFSGYFRPIQNWSYMVDYWIWNQNSFGYHLSNILLHAFAAWLLLLLLRQLLVSLLPTASATQRDAMALLVALVWAVHPIHNAAVAYISGRADTLAMIFVLLSWLACRRAITSGNAARIALFVVAWIAALLAILSKEIAIVWFAFFLVTLLAFTPELTWKQKGLIILGLLLVIGAYLGLRLSLPHRVAAPVADSSLPLRCLMALRALGDYGGLIFWPANLHMERMIYQPFMLQSAHTWPQWAAFQWLTLAGILVIALFAAGILWKSSGQRLRLLAVIWFVIGFLPISNLFPLNAQSAEHWIYMPSVGFILFVVSLIFDAPRRLSRGLIVGASIALVPLAARTAYRTLDWVTPAQFYTRTIQQGGGSWRTHMNLAVQYLCQGDAPKAEQLLRRTLKNAPVTTLRISLGLVLAIENKSEEARQYLVFPPDQLPKVLQEYPNNWQACFRVATDDFAAGKSDEALDLLRRAREVRGDVWELFRLQNQILSRTGKAAEAIANVRKYNEQNWWRYDSHLLLAQLLTADAQPDEAVATLRQAARLDIHAGEPFTQIADIELGRKHFDAALSAAQTAIDRTGGLPGEYLQLARIYDAMGDTAKAQQAFEVARSMGGTSKKAQDIGDFL